MKGLARIQNYWKSLVDKYRLLKVWQKILFWVCFILTLHWLYLLILTLFLPPITTTQISSLFEGHGLHRDYVDFSKITYNAGLAVIAAEDQLFADHFGLDYESIDKAMEYNKTHTKKKRGASTISQQVAKNVFLWQGRSWIRKGLEVYFTFMIELLWTKKHILEVYLNSIEMGKGIFGIEAAAQYYFNKSSDRLTREECAAIASILPNPKKYKVHSSSTYMSFRKQWILEQMEQLEPEPDLIELLSEMKH